MTAAPSARERVLAAYERMDAAARPTAWITVRSRADALADADEIDRRVASGESLPLTGLVFAVKDNIDVAGLPTTAACAPFEYLPSVSAVSVARLLAAGAIVLGKTNMDQFATGLVGTRSPYGAVGSAADATRVSGGSSSGSAVVVALGIVDFALGTDTAGSGRVPASFNGIVGIKPTLGLVPIEGVVPACRSYDCVTVFAPTIADAQRPLGVMTGPSPSDHRSRAWSDRARLATPSVPRVAIPRLDDLAMLTPAEVDAFGAVADRLLSQGVDIEEIELAPFLECARLLYDGALVAERYEAFGIFLEEHADAADPSVLSIVRKAKAVVGADVIRDQNEVLKYRLLTQQTLAGFDALLLPTTVGHPTIEDVAADPIGSNALLGTFSNFVNLLDMCAVSVPGGEADGHPFGVTIVARGFDDQVAIDLANRVSGGAAPAELYPSNGLPLAVFGAHMRGLPLNYQLEDAGARFIGDAATAPRYRMYALPGPIPRPGVVDAAFTGEPGVSIAGELWMLPPVGLARFLNGLASPMTLGPVELADGRVVTGFGCSAPAGGDISEYGGWREYLAASRVAGEPAALGGRNPQAAGVAAPATRAFLPPD